MPKAAQNYPSNATVPNATVRSTAFNSAPHRGETWPSRRRMETRSICLVAATIWFILGRDL